MLLNCGLRYKLTQYNAINKITKFEKCEANFTHVREYVRITAY